ncbi:hypothetical protein D3C72_1718950 [compost metagenome]
MLQEVLLGRQLSFDEVIQLVVIRAHGQLVDTQFVQPQQLHQHAVEMGEFVLYHSLLTAAALGLWQACQPLAMGLSQG